MSLGAGHFSRARIGAGATIASAIGTAAFVSCMALPTFAQSTAPTDWTARKCALYRVAWAKAASGDALDDVSEKFLSSHNDFLASDCTRRAVCPRTPQELALADTLSLMAVAEGMAGSFLPFTCKAPSNPTQDPD
ncbi:hypothetical protein O4H61_10850 [Roseovarius aestuarii]|nr:hypothetical protein [Roseovarius aestuarii]